MTLPHLSRLVAALLLAVSSFSVIAGEYVISRSWPTGVHAQSTFMWDKDRPLCEAAEKALRKAPRQGPFVCDQALDDPADGISPAKWQPIAKDKIFPLAKRLEILIENSYGRDGAGFNSDTFAANARKLIASGEMMIGLSRIPVGPHGEEMLLLRYQRHGCHGTETHSLQDFGNAAFFRAESDDLTHLDQISGLGSPTDVILFSGQAFFISHSFRDFDDGFQHRLSAPQPALFLHEMYNQKYFVTVCRLLYWDKYPGRKQR